MGIAPSDYDVATSAHPKQVRQIFGHANTVAVGAAFGVILVHSPDRRLQVEVATFRTDSDYSDGRHPDSVTFSTPEMDAQRRDFTINGIFYDPIEGRVIDYVGGQQDIADRTLRAIGDPYARIREDRLRMLRAIRFAARFSLRIESDTYKAVEKHAVEANLISGERIAIELRKTLETIRPALGMELWQSTGLMLALLPEISTAWSHCGEQILRMLESAKEQSWLGRFACMIWSAGPESTVGCIAEIKSRLRLSNEEVEALRFALSSQENLAQGNELPWSKIQPLLVSAWIRPAVELLQLRVALGEVQVELIDWIEQRLQWPTEQLNPAPLVTGNDLIQEGIQPSPKFKSLLATVRELQLDGGLRTTQQALQWIRNQL